MAVGAKTGGNKRIEGLKIRMLDNKKVVAVLYDGRANNNGKYLAGMVDDKLVLDKKGVPKKFRDIGMLV